MPGLDPGIHAVGSVTWRGWCRYGVFCSHGRCCWIPVDAQVEPWHDMLLYAMLGVEGNYEGNAMPSGWVYIMTNRPNGILYTGVTSNLPRRIWEHREGVADGFTKQYGLKRLVFAEPHEDIRVAIAREKALKSWLRAWKVRLILDVNPSWTDLYDLLAHG